MARYDAEVEYLYSDGNQYINLQWDGDSAKDAFTIEYKMPSPVGQMRFFSGDTAGPNMYANGQKVLAYSSNWSNWRATNMGCGTNVRRKYFVDFYNKKYRIDNGALGNISNDSTAISTNMVLIGPMGTNPQFVGYIYSAQISREDILSVDLIPVRVGSIGFMYDRVRDILLPNAGAGNFIVGPDVEPQEKHLAINYMSLGDFRRRLMMGISTQEVPYPDNYVDDGWIWAYYEVTDTENPTQLIYASFNYPSDFGATFIIDGEAVANTKAYTFSTTGEHLVKMQRTGQIRAGAFRSLTALKRIYICDTVTSLAENTFLSSTNLTHIWLPDTITSIGNQSFSYCNSLYRVNIENTRITVAQGSNNYGLFRGSTSIKKVKLPTTVTAINGRCFQSCSSLNYVNIEELTSLTSIAILAFSATKLKGKIVFPSSLTSIANQAFQSCTLLEEADFGNTQLTTISGSTNYGCFGGCSHLAKITLPSTLTTLAQRAFYQCYALETVICKAVTPPTISSQSLPGTSYVKHIYVPAESVDTYKAASGWSSYASIIEAIPTT